MPATQVNLKESTVDFIKDLVEQSYHDEDMYEFIAEYGENNFVEHYENYVQFGESHSYEAVDVFIEEFGIDNLQSFEDAYYGEYETPEIFVENYVNDTDSGVIPDYIVVDWEATWNSSFQYDFSFVEGFIFNKNF